MSCIPNAGEIGEECSGKGVCVVDNATGNAACVCDYPYTSIGDFATNPSVDCGIHFIATRGLWGVSAAGYLCTFLVSLRLLLLVQMGHIKINRLEAIMTGLVLLVSALFLCVGVLEACAEYPGQRSIGIDPVTTTLFVVGSNLFWIAVSSQSHILNRKTLTNISRTILTLSCSVSALDSYLCTLSKTCSPERLPYSRNGYLSTSCFVLSHALSYSDSLDPRRKNNFSDPCIISSLRLPLH
jgi:hypothetical protein